MLKHIQNLLVMRFLRHFRASERHDFINVTNLSPETVGNASLFPHPTVLTIENPPKVEENLFNDKNLPSIFTDTDLSPYRLKIFLHSSPLTETLSCLTQYINRLFNFIFEIRDLLVYIIRVINLSGTRIC